MVYVKEVPQATERPSVSQPKIKENFTQINDQFGVDHTELAASSNLGKHKKVTLYEQADDPETLDNEVVIYAKEGNDGTDLYVRGENNGAIKKLSGLNVLAMASTNMNGTLINDRFNVGSVSVVGAAANNKVYRFTFENPLADNQYAVSTAMANGYNRAGVLLCQTKNASYVDISFDSLGNGVKSTGIDLLVYKV